MRSFPFFGKLVVREFDNQNDDPQGTIRKMIRAIARALFENEFEDENHGGFNEFSFPHAIRPRRDPLAVRLLSSDFPVERLESLLSLGMNPNAESGNGRNLLHETLLLLKRGAVSVIRAKAISTVLIKHGARLFPKSEPWSYEKGFRSAKDSSFKKDKQSIYDAHFLIDQKMEAFFLSSAHLSEEEKNLLEYLSLKRDLAKLDSSILGYVPKGRCKITSKIEKTIARGRPFVGARNSFHAISEILCHYEEGLFDELVSERILTEFERLSDFAKTAVASILIKNHKESALAVLFGCGLSPNSEIRTKNGFQIAALAAVGNIDSIKLAVGSDEWEPARSNSKGESMLHLIGGLALEDSFVSESIAASLRSAHPYKKRLIFGQRDSEGLTPMMKAISQSDSVVIAFLLENGDDPFEETEGVPPGFESAAAWLSLSISSLEAAERRSLSSASSLEFLSLLKTNWDFASMRMRLASTPTAKSTEMKTKV